MDAEGARDVAGRRDDAAPPAADDHGPIGEFRSVALFDRRVEGVAIDMGNGEGIERGMAEQARRPAAWAARPAGGDIVEAVPAESVRHGALLAVRLAGQDVARGLNMGGLDFGMAREREDHGIVAEEKVEHAGEKTRVGGGRANRRRADARFSQESAQPGGIARDEGQSLNRNGFSHLRGLWQLFHDSRIFAFP